MNKIRKFLKKRYKKNVAFTTIMYHNRQYQLSRHKLSDDMYAWGLYHGLDCAAYISLPENDADFVYEKGFWVFWKRKS